MKIHQSIRKKLLVGLMTVGIMLSLTGCELPKDIQSNISNIFRERAEANIKVADVLHNSGIISDDCYKRLTDTITKNLTDFGASINSADSDAGGNLLKACVGWRVIPKEETNDDGSFKKWNYDDSEWNNQFITNLLVEESKYTGNVPVIKGNSQKIKAIEVISESVLEEMNSQLSIPVWVLKTDINDPNGLDGIIAAVKQAETDKSENGLANYFQPATYKEKDKATGTEVIKPITLMDPIDPDEQLVRVTKGADTANKQDDNFYVNNPYADSPGGTKRVSENSEGTGKYNTLMKGFSGSKEVGYDMTIVMGGEPILSVRLIEFNSEAVAELNKRIGLSNKRYLVLNNRAYLMEYPIGYIDGFKESEDRTKYNSVIKRSELGFNLLTGDFSKFTVENGKITNQSVITNKEDPYLTYDGAKNASVESQSSLVLYGETGITGTVPKGKDGKEVDLECNEPWDLKLGGGEDDLHSVSIGRIVLRDYLEATYAPGIIGTDKLVVLGRKMRILQLEGDKKTEVARFYGKDGKQLGDDSAKLYIDDFADVGAIVLPTPTVKYISRATEELSTDTGANTTPDTGNNTTTDPDEEVDLDALIKNSVSKIDKLDRSIVSKISSATKFPGEYIGKSDRSETDNKPLFYAMAVKKNMFETGLFSGWVQSTDQEKNSTIWWNDWLGKHSYSYKINTDQLVKYLKGNYAYDLNQSGVIILDLETIAKIQQEYTEQHQADTAHGLRTLFIVVGYILIAYATILLISWNVDVNVDLGFNILEKISFGKWVAIKDFDEMPGVNPRETNFITFGPLVVSCICIIGLGMLLIMVNIIDVILMLIQLFGGIASYITKIITGVK